MWVLPNRPSQADAGVVSESPVGLVGWGQRGFGRLALPPRLRRPPDFAFALASPMGDTGREGRRERAGCRCFHRMYTFVALVTQTLSVQYLMYNLSFLYYRVSFLTGLFYPCTIVL